FRWAVLLASAAFLVLAVAVLFRGGSLTSGMIHGLEAEKAQQIIDSVTGHPADTTFVVVLHADGLDANDPAFLDAVHDALSPLRHDPRVASVVSPADLPEPYAAALTDGPGGTVFALVTMRDDYREALRQYAAVRAQIHSDRLSVTATGRMPYMHDLD